MDEHKWLAERFEEHRTRLRAVAYPTLSSLSDADDAVQEAWLRLSRMDGRSQSWASRSDAGRSSKSTCSPTPSVSACSTWRSSTTDKPIYIAARDDFGSPGPTAISWSNLVRLMMVRIVVALSEER